MALKVINIPKELREKLGEQESTQLTDLFAELQEDSLDHAMKKAEFLNTELKKDLLDALKEQKLALISEDRANKASLAETFGAFKEQYAKDQTAVMSRIGSQRTQIQLDLAETKSSVVRWMFLFWAGQTGIILGLFALYHALTTS